MTNIPLTGAGYRAVSVGTSVGGTYYMRKFVSIDDTFSSNYDLT